METSQLGRLLTVSHLRKSNLVVRGWILGRGMQCALYKWLLMVGLGPKQTQAHTPAIRNFLPHTLTTFATTRDELT